MTESELKDLTGKIEKGENINTHHVSSITPYQREELNKKIAEANIKDDIKNRIRQQVMSLGVLPPF